MELQKIQSKIFEIRGSRIMIDFHLAELYEVQTKRLKEAVNRNIDRFPSDFMFVLTIEEYDFLRSQIATLKNSGRGQHSKYLPYAFTEQGVAMLASVLHSQKAIQVNISIVRAFVTIRQYALNHKELTEKLNELEKKYNKQFKDVYEALNYLIKKDEEQKEMHKRVKIGFKQKGKS